MARSTPVSHRPTGHNGNSLPPYSGGGDDGRNDRGSGDSMPNYGQRLRRARLALVVFMAPILMLFISFTVVYLVRRGFVSFDVTSDTPSTSRRSPNDSGVLVACAMNTTANVR